ncbi:sortase family protein [Sinorhizobium chiapasense]|uniref:Uncharacterized protein n=1 Tax=Sinorhizobium chiapasense TaxID=501572 RepID=A0ABZ2B4R3_9HYPH
MADDDDLSDRPAGFLARLSAIETIVVAIIALIALAGLLLIGKGFYMKARAEVSQALLRKSFEEPLRGAANGRRAGEARWHANGINTSASGRHLALATCWPFDAVEQGPMRYIVNAELVGEQRALPLTTGSISR